MDLFFPPFPLREREREREKEKEKERERKTRMRKEGCETGEKDINLFLER